MSVIEGFDYSRIMSIHRMKTGYGFIIGTDGNGLFHFQMTGNNKILSRFSGYPGLETLSVKSIIQDSQNNLWISTSGTGAVKLQFLNNQ